jgi:hypothetical protein
VLFPQHYYDDYIENETDRSFMCGKGRNPYKITVGRVHLKDLGIDGRIIIKYVLWK